MVIDLDRLFGGSVLAPSTLGNADQSVVPAVPTEHDPWDTASGHGNVNGDRRLAGVVPAVPVVPVEIGGSVEIACNRDAAAGVGAAVEEPRARMPWDDRRRCVECQHLAESGRCRGVELGLLPDVDWPYRPVPDLLRRCEGFAELVDMPKGCEGACGFTGPSVEMGTASGEPAKTL